MINPNFILCVSGNEVTRSCSYFTPREILYLKAKKNYIEQFGLHGIDSHCQPYNRCEKLNKQFVGLINDRVSALKEDFYGMKRSYSSDYTDSSSNQ